MPASSGMPVIKTPVRSPRANSFAERYAGTLRRECPGHLLIYGEQHLRRTLTEYARHHNEHRPHQSQQQRPPLHEPGQAVDVTAEIKRRQVVHGLINEYRRPASQARKTPAQNHDARNGTAHAVPPGALHSSTIPPRASAVREAVAGLPDPVPGVCRGRQTPRSAAGLPPFLPAACSRSSASARLPVSTTAAPMRCCPRSSSSRSMLRSSRSRPTDHLPVSPAKDA